MKSRRELTAAELPGLYADLNRRLDAIGIETQPEVAMRLLELVSDPDAGLNDFAKVIRNDVGLTGRLLRLANSAYFAQRRPVTSIDRACVVLGRERLRACSLGFYLSRAATTDASCQLSRRVWSQSVFRACLAAELARVSISAFASEAFVVGLMLDAGVPLMLKLIGPGYQKLLDDNPTPSELFAEEFNTLAFTHADVVTALTKRWNLPDLLAGPISWHHVSPGETHRDHALYRMQRIAFYIGAADLRSPVATPAEAPMPALAFRVLGFTAEQLSTAVASASDEYRATIDIFSQVAEKLPDQNTLAQRVHNELLAATEQLLVMPDAPQSFHEQPNRRFRLGGYTVEIEQLKDGYAALYLVSVDGERLISYHFLATDESPHTLRGVLGLDARADDEIDPISAYLRKLAA